METIPEDEGMNYLTFADVNHTMSVTPTVQ